jgi:hypothetical protein
LTATFPSGTVLSIIGQLARWLEVLSQYSMQIQHRSGNKHVNADILSRGHFVFVLILLQSPYPMRQYQKQKFLSYLELPELVSFAMQISIFQKQSAIPHGKFGKGI